MINQLTIPDALIAWGKQPEVAVHFHRPWAHEVERIAAEGAETPLDTRGTERLLARLEALCFEAIRHGEGALLLGLDMFTAEWLSLVFSWPKGDETVSIGRGKKWSYQEVRALLDCPTASESLDVCEKVKDLFSDAFPQARIGAIIDAREATPDRCASCGGEDSPVMFTMESGNRYCGKCWSSMTSRAPAIPEEKKKKGRRKGRARR
jgi:hypothetical protein